MWLEGYRDIGACKEGSPMLNWPEQSDYINGLIIHISRDHRLRDDVIL